MISDSLGVQHETAEIRQPFLACGRFVGPAAPGVAIASRIPGAQLPVKLPRSRLRVIVTAEQGCLQPRVDG
jgi:hypothetical protein